MSLCKKWLCCLVCPSLFLVIWNSPPPDKGATYLLTPFPSLTLSAALWWFCQRNQSRSGTTCRCWSGRRGIYHRSPVVSGSPLWPCSPWPCHTHPYRTRTAGSSLADGRTWQRRQNSGHSRWLHYITLQSFSRCFYPKRLTISEFNIGRQTHQTLVFHP